MCASLATRHCSKLIVVEGIGRSGTNLVWNLLQSHPQVVSPGGETGEVLYPIWVRRWRVKPLRLLIRLGVHLGVAPFLSLLNRRLHRGRLATLSHPSNRFKTRHSRYTMAELLETAVVTKSVGRDIAFTPTIARKFPEVFVISVVRQGLAVSEGWVRRGFSARRASKKYVWAMRRILSHSNQIANHKIVRFEDLTRDPETVAQDLFRFVGLETWPAMEYRLKMKPVVNDEGEHIAPLGQAGEKVWLKPGELKNVVDGGVDAAQQSRLAEKDRNTILNIIGPVSTALGYQLPSSGQPT